MHLPNNQHIDTKSLNLVFKNTTSTYKFYWFYSILQMIENNRLETTQQELIASMIGNVWFSISKYRLSFGAQDKLANIVDAITNSEDELLNFETKTTRQKIITGILVFLEEHPKTTLAKNILSLNTYVPYRFLRPWCEDILKHTKSSHFEKVVKNYASDIDETKDLPYFFEKGKIIFHPKWVEYFRTHLKVCKDYCLWNLLLFLQKRNPNVPNIAEKLFAPNPKNRTLTAEWKYWKMVYQETQTPLRCIFSDELIKIKDYALDHFIPWSFVTHDLLWNLIPIIPGVNSSKSDHLPNLDLYFKKFGAIQFEAFHIGVQLNKKKKLEDYLVLGNSIKDISRLSKNDFIQKLDNQIQPLAQIAQNMGFRSNWVYQTKP